MQNQAVTHVASRRHVPQVDAQIIVELPGERTRATVIEMIDDNTLVAELTSIVMGKSHVYRTGMTVPVQRKKSPLEGDIWEVIDEMKMRMRENASKIAQQVARENDDATSARVEQASGIGEHQGADGDGSEPEPERRDSPVKRKKASA